MNVVRQSLMINLRATRAAELALVAAFACALLGCDASRSGSGPTPLIAESKAEPKAIIVLEQSQELGNTFEVIGLPANVLTEIGGLHLNQAAWQQFFTVHVFGADEKISDAPPMLGEYSVTEDLLRFTPQFPLEPGTSYVVQFDWEAFADVVGTPFETASTPQLVEAFEIPATEPHAITRLTTIYPTADVVPDNLLKLYLCFSAPMSRGDVYQYIHLLNSDGEEVELPFLEISEELWDRSQQRLTVLFDPGRIKKGLRPNEEVGPPLLPGQTYTLRIDQEWLDAHGQSLEAMTEKTFRVSESDAIVPQYKQWKIASPKTNSRNPLTVTFGESLDYALATRCLAVVDATDSPVDGEITLASAESAWSFVPNDPWTSGKYSLAIATIIEDIGGNSIARPFEVDMTADDQPDVPDTVELPFVIE